jgi:hypothetical protein
MLFSFALLPQMALLATLGTREWTKTINHPELQDFAQIALGFGHNSTLSHRLFWTLRIVYKL